MFKQMLSATLSELDWSQDKQIVDVILVLWEQLSICMHNLYF